MASPEKLPVRAFLPHQSPLQPARLSTAHQQPGPMQGISYAQAEEEELPIEKYWRTLWPRRWLILATAVVFAILGFLLTIPQKRIYRARLGLEIENLQDDVLGLRHSTDLSANYYDRLSDVQTQIKILKSETLADRTIAKLKPSLPSGAAVAIPAWRRLLGLKPPTNTDPREGVLRSLADTLKATAAGESRVIEVSVEAADPKLAANFANTLASEFIEQAVESRWNMSEHIASWLSRQMDDMRIKLERSEDELQVYAKRAGLLFTGEGDGKNKTSISDDKLRETQQALSAARIDRIAKQTRYEMARTSPPDSLPDIINDTVLRELQSKLTDLRREEAELSATYKPEYVKLKRVRAEAATVQSALQTARADILGRIHNEYDEAVRREDLLNADYIDTANVVTAEGEKAIQYNILKREVDTNRQLYEAMLGRVKEASVTSAIKAANVRIIDQAKTPKFPVRPNIPLHIVMGFATGIFVGIAIVTLREKADRTLQDPGDTSRWVKAPELGAIPAADVEGHRRFYAARAAVESGSANPDSRVEMVTVQRRSSMIAEAFRVVLTSLLFWGDEYGQSRAIVVTSSSPGEGKTTVACNLAIAMSEIGRRVLLIDADLRRPRIHDVFRVANERGLSTVLRATCLPETDVLDELVAATSVPGLSVLTSGAPTAAAANLLHSKRLPELISYFRTRFDMIVVDTPPMLHMSDARVAGRVTDGVVLVVRSGKTTRDVLSAVCENLSSDNTPILGTILNDWNPRKSRSNSYGRGDYYTSYQRYAPDDDDSSEEQS